MHESLGDNTLRKIKAESILALALLHDSSWECGNDEVFADDRPRVPLHGLSADSVLMTSDFGLSEKGTLVSTDRQSNMARVKLLLQVHFDLSRDRLIHRM